VSRRFLAAAALALASSACSLGFGSAYVGQWRERDEVDYRVCIEDQAGGCSSQRTITTHHPARRYWGVHLLFPALGIAQGDVDGAQDTALRAELGVEYLRGRGDLAFGVRVAELWDAAADYWFTAPMVSGIGHLGLSDRFSAYGGLGAAPYSRLSLTSAGSSDQRVEHAYLAGRALAGLQMVLAGNQESRVLLGLEADTVLTRFDGASFRSSSLTFQLGLSL
jgi:hypothetical protein